jgi:hypothetical protein
LRSVTIRAGSDSISSTSVVSEGSGAVRAAGSAGGRVQPAANSAASTPNTASVIAITMLQVRREREDEDGMGALSHRVGAPSRVRNGSPLRRRDCAILRRPFPYPLEVVR